MKTKEFKEKIKKYPYMYAYGVIMGSFNHFIEFKIDRAIADNAPVKSIYKQSDGNYMTVDNMKNEPF